MWTPAKCLRRALKPPHDMLPLAALAAVLCGPALGQSVGLVPLRFERMGDAPADTIDSVAFLDPDRGWAAESGRAWLTRDGGRRWAEVLPPRERADLGIEALSWPALDALFVLLADGALLRTPDLGTTWHLMRGPARYPDGQAVTILFLTPRLGWLGGGRWVPGTLDDPFPNNAHDDHEGQHRVLHAALWMTTDGGLNWALQALPDSGAPRIRELWFRSGREGAIRGEDQVFVTRDGGASWAWDAYGPACVRSGLENKERFVRSMWMLDGQVGWLSLGGGPLLQTVNGAATWCEVEATGRAYFEQMAFATESVGVGIGGRSTTVWETRDGGRRWEPAMDGAIGRAVAAVPGRAVWVFTDEGVYRAEVVPAPVASGRR